MIQEAFGLRTTAKQRAAAPARVPLALKLTHTDQRDLRNVCILDLVLRQSATPSSSLKQPEKCESCSHPHALFLLWAGSKTSG